MQAYAEDDDAGHHRQRQELGDGSSEEEQGDEAGQEDRDADGHLERGAPPRDHG
jgi:hypothetical protein